MPNVFSVFTLQTITCWGGAAATIHPAFDLPSVSGASHPGRSEQIEQNRCNPPFPANRPDLLFS
jgi:hypothetical protein